MSAAEVSLWPMRLRLYPSAAQEVLLAYKTAGVHVCECALTRTNPPQPGRSVAPSGPAPTTPLQPREPTSDQAAGASETTRVLGLGTFGSVLVSSRRRKASGQRLCVDESVDTPGSVIAHRYRCASDGHPSRVRVAEHL